MKKRNGKILTLALGVLAAEAYRAAKGKGVFNGLRFASQHDSVSKYVEAHHPGAVYSAIEAVGEGWTCVISDGGEKYLLYFTRSPDGVYIFDENKI